MATVIKGSGSGQINLNDTTGSIQLNGSDVLTIDSSGNLTAPNNLTASGNLSVTGTVTQTGNATFNGTVGINGATNNIAQLEVKAGNSTIHQLFLEQNNTEHGWQLYADQADGGLAFFRRDNSGQTERMRIDSSGNLLIGTGSQIHSGNSNTLQIKTGNYPQIVYQNTGASTSGSFWLSGQSTNDNWYLLPDPQSRGVYLTYTSTTGWSAFSDETLKENLVPIENALDKINTLRTVTGNYIDDPEHPHVFLIAQDVQAILPEAVHMNLDYNVLGMNYNEIIPLLTAGIKELKEENDTLKSQLSSLETRIQALESANV